MKLNTNLELSFVSYAVDANGVERNVQVLQRGPNNSRTNVDRFCTDAFNEVLKMLDAELGIDLNNIKYSDSFTGVHAYDDEVIAQNGRSNLLFPVNDGYVRDFSLVVNPDGSKFVLIRLPRIGRRNGPEEAFSLTENGMTRMMEYIEAQYK